MSTSLKFKLVYKPKPPVEGAVLCRMRDDNTNPYWNYQPRQFDNIKCPPMVNPLFVDESLLHGGITTNMSKYGWEAYMRKLNPGNLFDAAVGPHLAMYNSGDGEGWPMQMSILMGCNLQWFVQASKTGWARAVGLNYTDGPPASMPTYDEDPINVMKFTMICREGAIMSRNPALYYPNVYSKPVYTRWEYLEPVSDDMVTQPPP